MIQPLRRGETMSTADTNGTDEFYTQRGYETRDGGEITVAMEDYLEMMCRIVRAGGEIRVRELAVRLHVKPSSASKMVSHLASLGYVNAERYGLIKLTENGRGLGDYLLYRHGVVERFLRALNGSPDETVQAERIEHFLDRRTVSNLDRLTRGM